MAGATGGGDAVPHHERAVIEAAGALHGGADTDVGADAGDDQRADSERAEQLVEVRALERVVAALARDVVVARLDYQPGRELDPGRALETVNPLVLELDAEVRQVGPVALVGEDDGDPDSAGRSGGAGRRPGGAVADERSRTVMAPPTRYGRRSSL